jgi:hypothetical protein
VQNKTTIQNLRNSGIPIYDTSGIRTFLWCPRGHYYRHELGLEPATPGRNPGLHFGVGGHLALETWFSPDTYKDDQKALMSFVDYFKDHEEVAKLGKTGKELKTTYSVIYGCTLLQTYFDRYRSDNRSIISLENAYAEEIKSDTYLVGKIDKLVEGPTGITFCDYKFTKYLNFLTHPNPQMCGYKYLIEKFSGEQVTGEVDIVGVSKSKDPSEMLSRIPIDYSAHSMNMWRDSVVQNIQNIEHCRKTKFWPQSWDCKPFFRDCDFMPLCTASEKRVHDELIDRVYKVRYWDPFAHE